MTPHPQHATLLPRPAQVSPCHRSHAADSAVGPASRPSASKLCSSIHSSWPESMRKPCHTHVMSPPVGAVPMRAGVACRPLATLWLRATRRLLQSGRCFAAHDICCSMRHGCRFHCAERSTVAPILSGLRQAIRATVLVRRRVNSPRPVSLSGSSTRSALHDFFCTQACPAEQTPSPSMQTLPPIFWRQALHTHPIITLPGDAA